MCTWLIPCQVAEADVTAAMLWWGERGAWWHGLSGPLASGGRLVAGRVSRDNGAATPESLCAFCLLISDLSKPKKGPLLLWCSDERAFRA